MEIQNSKDWAKVYRACGFIEKGVCEYADERVYLSEETLIKSLPTIKGRPVIIDHMTGITPENMNDHAVGYVVDYEVQGACDCKFVIFDDEGKKVIADGYSVSCAYKPKSFGPGGTWHNVPYDREITDLEYTHLALVQNPRYEDAKVYENAKDDDGKWITIKGTHVFVKKGQSVEDAMKETFKSSPTEKKEDDELVVVEKADPKAIKKEKEAKDRWDKTMKEYGELSGKYAKEDADFDIDQIKKDIKTVQSKGYESVEDIAEFLGLDEDEVRETIGEGDRSGSSFDEEGWKKFVEANKKKDVSLSSLFSDKDLEKAFQGASEHKIISEEFESQLVDKLKDVYGDDWVEPRLQLGKEIRKVYDQYEKRLLSSFKEGEEITPKAFAKSAGLTVGRARSILDSQIDGGNIQYLGKDTYRMGKSKEKYNEKEDTMKVDEFFNKMGEMIEEKLNACKSKMNEGDEEEKEDDDDKFEMDGETYSKKELVNAWKEKKNAEESKEKSDEESEEESEEKSNEDEDEDEEKQNGKEFFNAMEKRMRRQAAASDKIEKYSQAKGLEKGRSIYTK